MTDIATSSNSQAALLDEFTAICNVDTEIARRFLLESNWNLETAVHLYFHANDPEAIENDDNAKNEQEIRRRNVARSPRRASGQNSAVVNRSNGLRLVTWGAYFRALFALPFQLFYHSIREIFLFIYALFGGNVLSLTDPKADEEKFFNDITKYPNSALIDWFNGTYNDALNEAKQQVRFLIVYLHSPNHQSTDTFLNNVIFTQLFSNFIRENNVIIWGTDVRTNEGYKVATSLHEINYPCLALICMRDNRLACILRITGLYALEPILTALETAISENRRFLNAIMHERAQRDLDNRLRREQEQDYQIALAKDRARENERRRLESERMDAERRDKEEQENLLKKKERLSEIRKNIRAELQNKGNQIDDSNIRISIRFPSGKKLDKIFGLDESLEMLFKSALAHESCPDDFSLVTSFPRFHLAAMPEWYREFSSTEQNFGQIKTFRDVGFENSLVVMVRDNDA